MCVSYQADEVGQHTLHFVYVHLFHLHHLQGHQECIQGQLVSLQELVPNPRHTQRSQLGYFQVVLLNRTILMALGCLTE